MRRSTLVLFAVIVAVLVAIGFGILVTASGPNAERLHHDVYFFIKRQGIYLVGGLVLCVAVALFDYHRWRDQMWLTWAFYGVVFVLLLLVFREKAINGSRRWINLGFLRLQPSELAKLATVIVIGAWMDRAAWRVELPLRGAWIPALIMGVLALPVLLEPDFGSTMVIASTGLLLMLVGGTKVRYVLLFGSAGVLVFIYKLVTNENRLRRMLGFFGDEFVNSILTLLAKVGVKASATGVDRAAYQADMSLAAIGNSDIWGAGYGESMQKYLYLPEAHTDFIFAVGAEELGILFSLGVLILFCLFFALAVQIARKASDRFGRYLVVGMAFIVFFQAVFNLGVVCKAFPTKGMALPFFSYGGTNLLSAFFAVGMILSVGIHSYREEKWKKSVLGRSRFQN